ncbi:Hemin import ATP-binding protein HmuV [Moritella viscosa]|uniref:Hemin import ATP-binding protein HmuV n=1 Tax=Moritella viscosa TaxID=80854 RepID=A0A1L0F3L2_9GAMM|nr:Hemin import ATP-binding protein HmuV [Moritella viscosa]
MQTINLIDLSITKYSQDKMIELKTGRLTVNFRAETVMVTQNNGYQIIQCLTTTNGEPSGEILLQLPLSYCDAHLICKFLNIKIQESQ